MLDRWLRVRRALFAVALAAATLLFLAPLPQGPDGPGLPLDKLGHVLVLAALGLLAARAWPDARVGAYVGLVLYAVAVEGVQTLVPYRSAEAWDAVAGALGAVAAFVPLGPSR